MCFMCLKVMKLCQTYLLHWEFSLGETNLTGKHRITEPEMLSKNI